MSGTFPNTVVPLKTRDLPHRGNGRVPDMAKPYRVTAFYDYPPVERSVVVMAEDSQRAMAKALLEGKVPALFRKDEFGWLLPIFWDPQLAGTQRWPTIIGPNVIAWGERGSRGELVFGVDEVRENRD